MITTSTQTEPVPPVELDHIRAHVCATVLSDFEDTGSFQLPISRRINPFLSQKVIKDTLLEKFAKIEQYKEKIKRIQAKCAEAWTALEAEEKELETNIQ
ncbi:hypothetical protein TKK_0011156 [Trichogramma kaykai]